MNEKRTKILCPKCLNTMVFTNKITPPVLGIGGLIYRCPTRDNQKGCGYVKEVLTVLTGESQELFEVQPVRDFKRPDYRRREVLKEQLQHQEV
ncbi:MAG: hypothetical protein ABIG46_01850 [Candidatus Omnitrophota bacterium]